ncbi:MAG: TIGR00153 family protein [bacterium]
MLFGQKESQTNEMLKDHIQAVQKTLDLFQDMMFAYLTEEEDYKELSYKVHDQEHEADELRRDVERNLYEGAFMPMFREDYIVLAELIDKVADRAETCADMIGQQKPDIPKDLREDYKDLVHEVVNTFKPIQDIVELMDRGDQEEIREVVRQIGHGEEAVDEMEWKLIQTLWKDDSLELAHRIHLRNLINLIASISDRIENISDRVNIMMVKRNV